MGLKEDLQGALGVTIADAIRGMIDGKYILNYGIVEEVMADGIVMVSPSVITKKSEYIAVPCVLGTIASDAFSLNIVPKEKDKVMVFYPRLYDHKMFTKESEGTIINASDIGYSPYTGIAFLMNQYQTKQHKNYITVKNGAMEAHLCYDEENSDEGNDIHNLTFKTLEDGSFESHHAYSKDDEAFQTNTSVSADGNISVETGLKDGGYNAKLSIAPSGALNYTNPKASADIKEDGVIEIKNENATVTIDSNGNITLDSKGKFTLKNNGVSLKDVIKGLAQEVKDLITVGSPATQKTSPATQGKIATWETSKLDQFFEG